MPLGWSGLKEYMGSTEIFFKFLGMNFTRI